MNRFYALSEVYRWTWLNERPWKGEVESKEELEVKEGEKDDDEKQKENS